MRSRIAVVVCLLAMAACGGGGNGGSTPPQTPPPAAPAPPPVIGARGGTITETSGATVTFPAGAIGVDTTFRVAMDSTGAPPLPAGLQAAGNVYVVTPHGGNFAQPVDVKIPVPAVTLLSTQVLKLAKAQPGGAWEILDDSAVVDGKLTAPVSSFSYFLPVIITYTLPIAQFGPYAVTTSIDCGAQSCDAAVGPVTATFTLVGNNGQFPVGCENGQLQMFEDDGRATPLLNYPKAGMTVTRTTRHGIYEYVFLPRLSCSTFAAYASPWARRVKFVQMPFYPRVAVLSAPAQLDVVTGLTANLDVVLGGALRFASAGPALQLVPPTPEDHAIIDWERSDNGGASWRVIARSFQEEGNSLPYGPGPAWQPWSVRHGFIANDTDQGALIRVRACYTPPPANNVAAPPCVMGPSTRLNVLQQSALPTIAAAPRSVLVRTGQTASLSVTAAGIPAPTLQWQTRVANSTGAWANVSSGAGATTANYTTAATGLADNGVQYRVVATNAIAAAESIGVTVSVSDLDVAPGITTQPTDLTVTSGSDAAFAVDARGTEALSYQWSRNGVPIDGANSAVLRLPDVTVPKAGRYTVTVSNGAGDADSDAAVLTVVAGIPAIVAPSIVTQPASITANAGGTATFAVGVNGTGPLAFQWRRDGVNIGGATSAVLTLNSVALPNAGSYSVLISNSAGSIASSAAVLDVTAVSAATAPSITSQPATIIIASGGSGTIAVGATGSGPLSYQWYLNGALLAGSNSPVLIFRNLSEVELGSYVVTVTNSVGSVTSQAAQVILLGAPVVVQQPEDATALEGEIATFFVVANSSGLRYQWSVNGTPIPGAAAATFRTPPLVLANSGAVYSVLVYNSAGLVYSQGAVLTVTNVIAPFIVGHPFSATIAPGLQAELCLTIAGTPTFDVQLQRWNGSAWVSGASVLVNSNAEVCYFTAPLTLADSGAQYQFHVSNPAGETWTDTAIVTVLAPAAPSVTNTTLVSRAIGGGPPNNISNQPSMSADGRYVAFVSVGTNLSEDADNNGNAYVRDLVSGATKLVNYNRAGDESAQGVGNLKISSGGRYVIFTSRAGDLVENDTNDSLDVFRRDLLTGTNERLSVLPNGDQLEDGVGGNGDYQVDISADGRAVIFMCGYDVANNGAINNNYYLYHRNLQTGVTRLVAGTSEYGVAYSALSDDGRWVAYAYGVSSPGTQSVNLYDAQTDTGDPVFAFNQTQAPDGLREGMSISSNGRYIAFAMISQNLLSTNQSQVVVVDRDDPNVLMNASRNLGVPGNGRSAWPEISGDGRYVLFSTQAPSLTNNLATVQDAYMVVSDLVEESISIASRRPNGVEVAAGSSINDGLALSEDGLTLAFVADHNAVLGGPSGVQVFATPRP